MRIAICDDQASCLEQTVRAAEQYAALHPERNLVFTSFSYPDDLIEATEKIGGFDVYILDIVMPGMNGISLGLKLRNGGYDGKIIYLTSSEDYSLDAFRVKAFDYILKPITEEAFNKVLDEALAQIALKKERYLLVKTKDRSIRIAYDSILYATLNRRTIIYHLTGGRTVESTSLRSTFSEATADLLMDRRFQLCSVSMAVNFDHITEIENEAIIFGREGRVFLGEKYCRKLRTEWSKYLFDEEV